MKHDARRTGGWRNVEGRYYIRVRIGKGARPDVRMSAVTDDATADVRARQIVEAADLLIAAGREHDVKRLAKMIGEAENEKQARLLVGGVREACLQSSPATYHGVTFAEFSARWTSGQLHRDHPDHVKKKNAKGDITILRNWVNDILGPIPMDAIREEDADRVMRRLPREPDMSSAYRRAVAQVIHRVLTLGVYPAKIIKVHPLPKGWLPKIAAPKRRSFLYPKEEATLLANRDLDFRKRFLVGFLNREGCRKSEVALNSEWADYQLDLDDGDAGTISLSKTKTERPDDATWALGPGVVRALRILKRIVGGKGPFVGVDASHLSAWVREALMASGVTRKQLFDESNERLHYRGHDSRTTFVTLSLAADKSEKWIRNRTGHKSSAMLHRYDAAASLASELNLGPLLPLDQAIPELAEADYRAPTTADLKRPGQERGRATRSAKKAAREKRAAARAAKAARLGDNWGMSAAGAPRSFEDDPTVN